MESRHFKLNLTKNELCKRPQITQKNHPEELQPCRMVYLKDVQMWHLGTWFSSGLGSADLTVELNGLKGVFQPQWFCDAQDSQGLCVLKHSTGWTEEPTMSWRAAELTLPWKGFLGQVWYCTVNTHRKTQLLPLHRKHIFFKLMYKNVVTINIKRKQTKATTSHITPNSSLFNQQNREEQAIHNKSLPHYSMN